MNRPSRLWVQVAERENGLKVLVGGQVTLVGQGEFRL
jgi:predicted PhzF superfamily epimerase YddE/YHI9